MTHDVATGLLVSSSYLAWAHEPAAMDGYAPARTIVNRYARRGRGRVSIPWGDKPVIDEIISAASVWANSGRECSAAPFYKAEAGRIMQQVREWKAR